LRDLRPDDAPALVTFQRSLSSESAQRQAAALLRRMSTEDPVGLTPIDHTDRDAFVGVRGHDIVAVGTSDRIGTTDIAEVTVVVAEPWLEQGVEAVLFRRLAARAQGRGCTGLEVLVRPEQERMLAIFQRSGARLPSPAEDGLVHVRLSLAKHTTAVASERGGAVMRWQRTSVRYITRYRSTDARYTIESVASAHGRWHLRRLRPNGSDLVGVFASARDASAAAEADAAVSRRRRRDEPGTGRTQPRR